MKKILLTSCFVAFTATAQADDAKGDAVRGKALYQQTCTACHSIDHNGVGPAHKNVFGAKAGTQPNYMYSPALAASGVIWTEKNLDRWLTQPEALVPGQKMWVSVDSAGERADVIAYLKSLGSK